MNVLIVSQYYWPESFRINEVVSSLKAAGCTVTVLTGQPNYPAGKVFEGYKAAGAGIERAPEGYDVIRVPLVPRGQGSGFRLALNYLSFVVSASLLGPWLLRGRRFDVIFVYAISPILQAIPAILLKYLKKAALVVWVQDLWPESLEVTGFVRNRGVLRAVGSLTSWIYRRCDRLLVQSKAFIAPVRSMAGIVPIAFHPNPGDVKRPEQPAVMTLPSGFTVVFAGNVGNAQSPKTLLHAAERLRDHAEIKFVVIGSGSRLEWLKAAADAAGLANIIFVGRLPSEAMTPVLRQASALLVTLEKADIMAMTIPSKIATYLAVGRPILAALDGEAARLVEEAGAGLTSPAEDGVALAARIVDLYALSDEKRDAMGRNGQRYFEGNFDPDILAAKLVDEFRVACGQMADRH